IPPDKVRVQITLPYPREIRSIRRIQTHCETFFVGKDAPPTPREIAMVQVLVYEVSNFEEIQLKPPLKGWRPKPNSFGTINLHIFAEPESEKDTSTILSDDLKNPNEPHYRHAYALLAKAFGLEISAFRTGQAEPDHYGVRGLTTEDTIGLHERKGGH